jgi:DNA repair exonuclease SbcCD ATPase subunit
MARHGELLAEQATSAASVARAEAESATAERDLNNALASLPTGATEWDPDRVAAELRDLEAGPVERDHAALADDRALRAERERQLADVERQIAEAIPPAARRPAAELAPALVTAERQSQLAQGARDAAVRAAADLEHRRIARAELHSRHADAARGAALHKRLVELLGPDGLQLDQVRQAERRIVELANGLLGRVSLGELRLEPPDPASTLPFDLKVRRLGCPDPIGVGNLSGGQRCRVAVALALAVCRYACGQARPLESVVIDEAFANLDRDGRMAMVELFRDGRVADGVFRRIILVSHHDDVAAAFPIGYRLTNDAGTTTATRFG